MKKISPLLFLIMSTTYVFGQLTHPSGYFTMYPYSSSYDDGSYAKIFYDGNTKKIRFWNSDNGTSHTGINVGKIYSTGYVGLGIENPDSRFHVVHSSGEGNAPTISGNIATFQTNAGAGYYASINLISGSTGQASFLFGDKDSGAMGGIRYNNSDNSMSFRTSGADNRIFISSSGNVGIETDSPSSKLDVRGGSTSLSQYLHLYDFDGTGELSSIISRDKNTMFWNGGVIVGRYNNNMAGTIGEGNLVVKGNVGVGTLDTFGYKLAVNGTIGATEVKVENTSAWPDFVFENGYELRTLKEVEEHIAEKGHLPEIPSEAEVTENGINLGEMDAKLLQKIEELTLYLIEQNKKIEALQQEVKELKNN